MSIQEQILAAVADEIDSMGLYAPVAYGPLSSGNGLAIVPAGGAAGEVTLSHGGAYSANYAVNGQHSAQGVVRDALCLIHEHLNKLTEYPKGNGWAVCGIRTIGFPEFIDRDENQWLYGSSIAVDYVTD